MGRNIFPFPNFSEPDNKDKNNGGLSPIRSQYATTGPTTSTADPRPRQSSPPPLPTSPPPLPTSPPPRDHYSAPPPRTVRYLEHLNETLHWWGRDTKNTMVNICHVQSCYRRVRTKFPCIGGNHTELSFEANIIISNGEWNVIYCYYYLHGQKL